MKNLFFTLMFLFLLLSGFSDNQVWVKAKMPFNIHAGDRFTIEITINKLDLQHFAEFKQKLPDGFIAMEKQSAGADFSFNNQIVKFTWLRLPRVPQITLSYDVILKENVKGQFTLPGQFTYIYNNQRGTAFLENDKINVYAKGEAFNKNNQLTDNNLSFPPKDPRIVQCLRIRPEFSQKQNGYIIRLLLSSGSIPSASKIEETIPNGYTASLIDDKGATFAFDHNVVEFIWKKMPDQKDFQVVYKISSASATSPKPVINGKLLYFSGGQAFSVPIQEVGPEILNQAPDKDINKNDVYNFFKD